MAAKAPKSTDDLDASVPVFGNCFLDLPSDSVLDSEADIFAATDVDSETDMLADSELDTFSLDEVDADTDVETDALTLVERETLSLKFRYRFAH